MLVIRANNVLSGNGKVQLKTCMNRLKMHKKLNVNQLVAGCVLVLAVTFAPLNVVESATSDPAANVPIERWAELAPSFFGDRSIIESSDVIAMEAPNRAHDAAIVPIVIYAEGDARQIKKVHLIVDKNPLPLAGVFNFSDSNRSAWQSFETRIRINEYTTVRAIAELDDGTLHMTSKFVKAAGGCSAPALSDMAAAMASAGKMKVLLGDISATDKVVATLPPEQRANAEATIKIRHPNNSGMQFDQISRNYIPAFYVHSIVAELDGQELLNVETNFSMSEDPVVRFQFANLAQAASFKVFAVDSKNNRYEQSVDPVM